MIFPGSCAPSPRECGFCIVQAQIVFFVFCGDRLLFFDLFVFFIHLCVAVFIQGDSAMETFKRALDILPIHPSELATCLSLISLLPIDFPFLPEVVACSKIGKTIAKKGYDVEQKVERMKKRIPDAFGCRQQEFQNELNSFDLVPLFTLNTKCEFCGGELSFDAPTGMRVDKEQLFLRGKIYIDDVVKGFVCCAKFCAKCQAKHTCSWACRASAARRGWSALQCCIAPSVPFFLVTRETCFHTHQIKKYEYRLFHDQTSFSGEEFFVRCWSEDRYGKGDGVCDGVRKRFRNAFVLYFFIAYARDIGVPYREIFFSECVDLQIERLWKRLHRKFVERALQWRQKLPLWMQLCLIIDGHEKLHRALCNCAWGVQEYSEEFDATLWTHCQESPLKDSDVCKSHEDWSWKIHRDRWLGLQKLAPIFKKWRDRKSVV